ncbi:MAG: hypothetical protein ACKV19_25400 [Verrucomicrobiales bacterium]
MLAAGLICLVGARLAPALAGTYRTIAIDGGFVDWAGIDPSYEDGEDEGDWTDLKSVHLANDENFLYVRLGLHTAGDPFTARNNYYFNTDNDAGTGFAAGVGSEMLVQGGAGYQERGGGFNEGGISGLGWLAAPTGSGTSFEFRVSRTSAFAADGTEVFAGDTIGVMVEAQNAAFARKDTAPDFGGLEYIFADKPPPLAINTTLIHATTTSWRANGTNTAPPPHWMALDFNDGAAGWTNGLGFFGTGLAGGPIQTSIAADRPTFYLRNHFSWNTDPAGVLLVATGYPSDGAVYYVNGVELRRTAMPAGPITHTTPALGTGPMEERFSIPTNALRQGENVLAVEAHQAIQGNSDFSFGFSLLAAISYPPAFPDATLPADQSVREGEGATLSAPVLVTEPATYQWFKDGVAMVGQSGPTLMLADVRLAAAGLYSLEVRNPAAPDPVRSREARLTVVQEAVGIIGEPVDTTIRAGTLFSLGVTPSGTGPFGYQWFRGDGTPIDGATLPTYGGVATAADAGEYYVAVSNPIPSTTLSRRVRVTVLTDTELPRLVEVTGANRRVVVRFSEPVDQTTASNPAFYSLSPRVTVLSAIRDPGEPDVVRLTTAAHEPMKTYQLQVTGVTDRFGNAILPGSSDTFRSSILIDGSFEDWEAIPVVLNDPEEGAAGALDIADVQAANDEDWLYFRLTLHAPGVFNASTNNIFIDANPDNSGYGVLGIGSEMLIQQGAGYQEKNGGFNEGPILGLEATALPEGGATSFEMRISLHARYEDGELVFVAPTLRFVIDAENSSFVTVDAAPDAGGTDYTVQAFAVGPLAIRRSSATEVTLEWTSPGELQFSHSLGSGAWQSIPEAVSPHVWTLAPDVRTFFRLILP